MTAADHRTAAAMARRPAVLLLDVVGLTPRAAAGTCPGCGRSPTRGCRATLGTVLPAVTCSVQSTFLTGGAAPSTASSATAGTSATSARSCSGASTTRSSAARRSGTRRAGRHPELTVANVCWWYAMGTDVDSTVTPRPVYHADGRK